MEQKTTVTDTTVPDVAPSWDRLYDRAEYTADARDDPTGGVVVHRCHPEGEAEDFFAFASRHETMKGYVSKTVHLFTGPNDQVESGGIGLGTWNIAREQFQIRAGSHEDCPVCQLSANPRDLLTEVVDRVTSQVGGEHNLARSGIYHRDDGPEAVVYLDTHGMATNGGPYSVPNSTRHWDAYIEGHPYVEMVRAEEVGEGGNAHSPDNTLRITLRTRYPDGGPGVVL